MTRKAPCTLRDLAARFAIPAVLGGAIALSPVAMAEDLDLNRPICRGEEDAFGKFIRAAQSVGKPDPDYAPSGNLQFVEHLTTDGVRLQGYRAKAQTSSGQPSDPKGYILFIQGNAMFADHMIWLLRALARGGYDAYIFDFRGYGRSTGKPSIRGIVSDYQELITRLNQTTTDSGAAYKNRTVYAISAGGAVFTNVKLPDSEINGIVLDSVPAKLDRTVRVLFIFTVLDLKCPDDLQPLNRLPESMSQFLIIQGEKDRQVPWDATQQRMLALAKSRGAETVVRADFGHAFMDSKDATSERIRKVLEFFDTHSESK